MRRFKKSPSRYLVLIGTLCLLLGAPDNILALNLPTGVPAPPFGIKETAPAWPAGWPAKQVPLFYYVDNTHSKATNKNNTYGYPTRPRKTIPEITYKAGSYVEIHGGPYDGGGQIVFTANGTATAPVWVRGASSAAKPTIRGETIVRGSYVILENLYYDTSNKTIGLRVYSGSSLHHAAVRFSEFAGPGIVDGSHSVIAISGASGNRFSDIVVYKNSIHDFGDNNASAQNDYNGIGIGRYADRVWILENAIYNMGGDSVRTGKASIPEAARPNYIYIAGNTFYGNYENCVDIKQSNYIVMSDNDFSNTGNALVVAHYDPRQIWLINNRFHGARGGFISTSSTGTYLVGNLFYNLHDPGQDGYAIKARGSTTLNVVNNTIYDAEYGIWIQNGSNHLIGRNNIIANANNTGYHILIEDSGGAAGSSLDNSLLWQNGGNVRIGWGTSSARDVAELESAFSGNASNNVESNPNFTDTAAFDFSVQSGSQAIDGGQLDPVYGLYKNTFGAALSIEQDIMHNARPAGLEWDMGAYEVVSP